MLVFTITSEVSTEVYAIMFMQVGVSSLSRDAGPSNEMDKLKGSSQHDNVQQDKSRKSIGDVGVDQIENMLKGKQFSR